MNSMFSQNNKNSLSDPPQQYRWVLPYTVWRCSVWRHLWNKQKIFRTKCTLNCLNDTYTVWSFHLWYPASQRSCTPEMWPKGSLVGWKVRSTQRSQSWHLKNIFAKCAEPKLPKYLWNVRRFVSTLVNGTAHSFRNNHTWSVELNQQFFRNWCFIVKTLQRTIEPWGSLRSSGRRWRRRRCGRCVRLQSQKQKRFLGDLNLVPYIMYNAWWWESPVGIKRLNLRMRVWKCSIYLILVMFGFSFTFGL